jgi:D-glycero-alpha-D-manno-heptose-7-phosphate kinase
MIRARAWCRVDFAGGTLDIWPLGLLHPGASTVNVAIDLPVEISLAPRERDFVVVQGERRTATARRADLLADPDTALVGLVLEHFALPPCEIALDSRSPRGAGLGASSALTVALIAVAEAARGAAPGAALDRARLARDLEARLMSLPTGLQDHLPAQLGGSLVLEHPPGGEVVRRLAVDLGALGDRLLVAYSGQSHFSAGNNWGVIRRRLDGDADVTARLDRIRDAALDVASALARADWAAAGAALGAEWDARRGLAPEISTARIETMLATARDLGAWGGKACGAGGGGCVAVLAPPERREELASRWSELGAQVLPCRPTAEPLHIESD